MAFGVIGLTQLKESYIVGEYKLQAGGLLNSAQQTIFVHSLNIDLPRNVTPSRIRLPPLIAQKIQNTEKEIIEQEKNKIISILKFIKRDFNTECWQRPLKSKIISGFGSFRYLPDGRSYYHTGVDLRAQINTPIHASASGVVVLAEAMTIPGNNIIIDHGDGVYSRYMHLSEFKVTVGQEVKKNDIIGLIGATGRVEAPHLHWEILWKENHADPLSFLEAVAQLCDLK
ncbi:MAG: hypothetical protein A2Z20_12785 [Bdellovibrionales bacterium RBG_16_40_8]|nr:MAG: hypothetical protein A2Z20_12785 [Bdellovibrionales bacterium RBG_16_40_8]